jgi:FtsP/CotA-like multicopper oxidase with cupredoxin domain
MLGWEMCSEPWDRGCWLRNPTTGKQYDVFTNYEDEIPIGTTRYYNLTLEDSSWDADGINFPAAKLFRNNSAKNPQYPGPWIQACWGDTIVVDVTNKLKTNGTSIHWHGIRQNQTMHMDGVNGITQCPIATNDHMVYEFKATQYGSSWYHSHYSVQYADGAAGPLTIHGPSSADWDVAVSPPLIMTDWSHNTAFNTVTTNDWKQKSILLNGRGDVTKFNHTAKPTSPIKKPYQVVFEKPSRGEAVKKYLMRVINTSFDTTFVFSIDNHLLQIVSADFVPIHPYHNTSILVGIGQRYNIIVEANPIAYNDSSPLPLDGNYWIRTEVAECFVGNQKGDKGYDEAGILRYNKHSIADPKSKIWPNVAVECSDETYTSLHPIVPWQVPDPLAGGQDHLKDKAFDFWRVGAPPKTDPDRYYPLAHWTLMDQDLFTPMRVNYSDPAFLHLDRTDPWPVAERIVPQSATDKDWIYLVFKGQGGGFGAHPIHLHGHDFALLEQAHHKTFDYKTLDLKLDNPPRRDVVLLPSGGYVVIAFKADNPGAWIVHCHIAFHISEGLGLTIMERQTDAESIWRKPNSNAIKEAERVCANWNQWYNNRTNWAVQPDKCIDGTDHPEWCFQDDSGV